MNLGSALDAPAAQQGAQMIAGPPRLDVAVPAQVQAVAAGQPVRAVWENELGGLTFEVGVDPDRRFVKWAPAGSGISLAEEAVRLSWAVTFTPVPRLLDHGADDEGSWMVTAAMPGKSAVAERWKAAPKAAVAAIGEGLRAMHEALPAPACPFSWTAGDRLTDARNRASNGEIDPAQWHPIHHSLGIERALDLLADVPPVDQLVVCHGDACAPNTLLTDDGRWSGHVDLGALGVADKWADLSIATWSTEWNYGPGWDGLLLDAYGARPDPNRTRYYRLLWDLGP